VTAAGCQCLIELTFGTAEFGFSSVVRFLIRILSFFVLASKSMFYVLPRHIRSATATLSPRHLVVLIRLGYGLLFSCFWLRPHLKHSLFDFVFSFFKRLRRFALISDLLIHPSFTVTMSLRLPDYFAKYRSRLCFICIYGGNVLRFISFIYGLCLRFCPASLLRCSVVLVFYLSLFVE
jgi:hypothetical protein